MIPLGKAIALVTRVARHLVDYRYRYVILSMEGLIITFFVLLWTIPSGNFAFRVLVWILTHQCILLAFLVKHQCVVYIAWSVSTQREGKHDINDNLQQ